MRKEWPYCGGVNGSIRFDSNLDLVAHAGLSKAIELLMPIKRKYRSISWADLMLEKHTYNIFEVSHFFLSVRCRELLQFTKLADLELISTMVDWI